MIARQVVSGVRKRVFQGMLVAMLMVFPVYVQAGVGVGVTGKVGTTGLGADLTVPLISNWVNLRAGYNWADLRPSLTQGDIKYDADVQLQSVPILLDLHPFHGNFRITGGVYYNLNEVDLSSTVSAGTTIGNTTYGSSVTLNANVDWSTEFAPYFGIGYGNAADDNLMDLPIAIGLSLDIGAFYQGSPDVVLTESSGTVSAADLAVEAAQIEDDLSDFKFYPVITLGIHIRF